MGPDVTGKEVVLLDKNGTRHIAPPPLFQHFRVAGHSLPRPPMYGYKPSKGPSHGERIHQQRLDHALARFRPAAGNFPGRKDACGARGSSYVYDPNQKWSESFLTSKISMAYCVFHGQDRHIPFPRWRAGGRSGKKNRCVLVRCLKRKREPQCWRRGGASARERQKIQYTAKKTWKRGMWNFVDG